MVDYDEEMALEPPIKRPEWPEWEKARGREDDAWRLEPEGETEVPETVIVADEVEGIFVDSNGEGHHGRGKVKNHSWRSKRPSLLLVRRQTWARRTSQAPWRVKENSWSSQGAW